MDKPGPQDPARNETPPPPGPAGEAAKREASPGEDQGPLDLAVERIDTEGVLKEGFAGQEM